MRVAHWSLFGPHVSGMYHTTKDLILAERELGIEAELLNIGSVTGGQKDGDFTTAPHSFADVADVYVLHSRVEPPYYGDGTPTVFVQHGHPLYSWQCELYKLEPGNTAPWSTSLAYYNDTRNIHRYVTMWSDQLPYWRVLAGPAADERVRLIPRGLRLGDQFVPDGPREGLVGDPVVVIVESFRLIKDILAPLFAASEFHNRCPNARVYMFGVPDDSDPMGATFRRMIGNSNLHRCIGDVHTVHRAIDRVLRDADLLVTSSRGESRVMLEALACGCDVVCQSSDRKLPGLHEADWRSPATIADAMQAALDDRRADPEHRDLLHAAVAEAVDTEPMARAMIGIFEELLGHGACDDH